jgi:hypothetical protein
MGTNSPKSDNTRENILNFLNKGINLTRIDEKSFDDTNTHKGNGSMNSVERENSNINLEFNLNETPENSDSSHASSDDGGEENKKLYIISKIN